MPHTTPITTEIAEFSEPLAIDTGNVHRFMLPMPEVAGAITMAVSCIDEGTIEVYRNNETGGMMLGFTCPGCDMHHPLIEIHPIDEALSNNERFLIQVRGTLPYRDYLEASQGSIHTTQDVHLDSRSLVSMFGAHTDMDQKSIFDAIFADLPLIEQALMDGEATFALDLQTGCTAIGYECDECDEVHGVMLLEMPKPEDMRNAPGYTFLGNPFLDLLLKATGERRH